MNYSVVCGPASQSAFGPAVVGCRDQFDLTITFERYFFSIVPSALLILAAPWRLHVLWQLKPKVNGHGLKYIKLSTIVALAGLQLAVIVVLAVHKSTVAWTPSLTASILSFISSLLLCALSYSEHSKSLRPSLLLNGYLFVTLLFDAVMLRSAWLSPIWTRAVRELFTAMFAIKTAILLLEAKEKRSYFVSEFQGHGPEESSGVYSQGVFWWLNRLMWSGARGILRPEDLYPISSDMSAEVLGPAFWIQWNHRTDSNPTIGSITNTDTRWPIIITIFPRTALLAFTLCQPLILKRLLNFLTDPTQDRNIGYGLIGAYGVVYMGIAISSAIYSHRHYRFLVMLRGTLITGIYQKATELNVSEVDNSVSVTLMSTDAERVIRGLLDLHEFWANIIQVAVGTWLISVELGLACVAPIAIAGVAFGFTVWLASFTTLYQMNWVAKIQERIGFTTELLGAMKYIKMSGLSCKVGELLNGSRVREVEAAGKFRLLGVLTSSLAQVPNLITPVVTFAIYSAIAAKKGTTLDASRLFTSLSLLILLSEPLFYTFNGVIDLMSAMGCFDRIQVFLLKKSRIDGRKVFETSMRRSLNDSAPDRTLEKGSMATEEGKPNMRIEPCVVVRDASFGWGKDSETIVKDVNLKVQRGQLAIIIGPVASGKSTLLKGILGETPVASGLVQLRTSKISWCHQSVWLTNSSIRKNIIGFSTFEAEFYSSVIHSCDLESDLMQLPSGDETVVGSKGFSLSGGQKQRIGLARALYARNQLAVFDDVFSHLDMVTQSTVFCRVFGENGLLKRLGNTAILATNNLQFLPHADHAIVLENGTIREQGLFASLSIASNTMSPTESGGIKEAICSANEEQEAPKPRSTPHEHKIERPKEDRSRQLGDWEVYRYYFAALSWFVVAMFLVLQVAWAFLSCFPNVWLKWWTDTNARRPNERYGYYIGIYAGFQMTGLISSGMVTWWSFNVMAVNTGLQMHEILAKTVMSAPLMFFSSTDSGSILTRFSQDIQLLDMSLPLAVMVVVTNMLICIAQIGLIASASAWIAVSFPFLIAVFYSIQKYYLRTSRQMRLLDLEEKAPLYTQFVETLDGLSTIRAFSWQQCSVNHNHELVDRSQKPFYLMYMIQRWLALVLDLVIGSLAVLVVGVAVALRETVSPGFSGVALTQIISFTSYLKLMVMFWAQMETSIGAVARIKQFNANTQDENLAGEDAEPPPEWPAEGKVEMINLSASYKGDAENLTLRNINMAIKPGEKIGICGRTGSGKSSLMLTLFRLLDLKGGKITIDDLDISSMPRDIIRSRIVSIAEEPFFIPGSFRENMDPYGRTADDGIIAALTKATLWETVQSKGGLGAALEAEGLSQGQRQLFSIARALLRRGTKLVVLDEATNNIDVDTDRIIQNIIREDFAGYTIIAVAHRLETILDFDWIAVMDQGEMVEYDRPSQLMSRASKFKALYESTHTKRG